MKPTVIVVGAGLAGMIAAYSAGKAGAAVVLLDRGSIGIGTNTALANGVFAGPGTSYPVERYIEDTIGIGRMLNSRAVVERVAAGAPEGIELLQLFGLEIAGTGQSYPVKPAAEGIIPGMTLVKTIAKHVLSQRNVKVITGFYVTEILRTEAGVVGVRGIGSDGVERSLPGRKVILACGGAGAVYLRNDNQRTIMGQSYRLAAKAGLSLWDMEFVQFFPLVFADPRLPSMILYPPYPPEMRLLDQEGKDVLKRLGFEDINKAVVTQRDRFSVMLMEEMKRGPVFADLAGIPAPLWERHPMSIFKKLKFDFFTGPVRVSPAAHFFMGGVRIDRNWETELKGLFAVGEMAWGLHGANRRGGNALTECVVSGLAAGRTAANQAFDTAEPFLPQEGVKRRVAVGSPAPSGSLRETRTRIREIAWESAGVVRSEQTMKDGISRITMEERKLSAYLPPSVRDRVLQEDLLSALFTLRAVLIAGLGRQESRGSFIREDFPLEDNERWRKNSCLQYDEALADFVLTHHDAETQ
jgi:succinate dehydrogenase/fumarate reductase flavoprotein subunit